MSFFRRILNELQNTGERPMVETPFEEVNPVLRFAYEIAADKARGKTVLDYGCGGGYGTGHIAQFTNERVVGYDIDRGTVAVNSKYYSAQKNLTFVDNLDGQGTFDLVVSFQVIEHIKDQELDAYLSAIKHKYLKEGGTFIVATVNKNITSYRLKKSIFPFHEHEFGPQELKLCMEKYFQHVTLYGQMDTETEKRVRRGEYNYADMRYSLMFRVIRYISQIEFVRFVARHIPLFVKNLMTGTTEEDRTLRYCLMRDDKGIENSYIILCECA